MISLTTDAVHATSVDHLDDGLIISLSDGRKLSIHIVWFPRLAKTSPAECANYELGNGKGIHWPQLDEDISVAGLLAGKPSTEFSPQT